MQIILHHKIYDSKIGAIAQIYGITQDSETKNYIMVLNDICNKCNNICNSIYFQRNFENWTSDNNDIDKFIQDTQLSAHDNASKALEWIPYNRFCNIKCIAGDEFDKVHRANWIDGCIKYWNSWGNKNQNWRRENQNMFVILKSLDNSKITPGLINKV